MIRARCFEYNAERITSTNLLEEQERELAPEIEEERQTERPPRLQAVCHEVHPDVTNLVRTGGLNLDSKAFCGAFATLASSSAASHLQVNDVESELLVTIDFAHTVETKGVTDSFFRMPQWVLTIPDPTTDLITHLVIISPHEAQELLPAIMEHQKVTLHLYAPRMQQAQQSLDKLDLYMCGKPMDVKTVPPSLVLQLNIFSGQTYLSSYEEYKEVCKFLGIRSTADKDDVEMLNSAVTSEQETSRGGMLDFVKVLFSKVRRDSEGIDKTHLGRMLDGAILTERDFEMDRV